MSRRSQRAGGNGGNGGSDSSRDVVAEAARIICEEDVLDYRSAKLKAMQRLGLSPRAGIAVPSSGICS